MGRTVKQRNQIRIRLIVMLLLLAGLLWPVYRAVRQELLNRQLITAIKHDQIDHSTAPEVLACLQRGADPNACDEPSQSAWNRLLILLRLRKAPAIAEQPALLLALEGEIKDQWDCLNHYVDPAIVKALLKYGADVR